MQVQPQSGLGVAASEAPKPRGGDASEWTVEEVISHIAASDIALSCHADLFRRHVSLQKFIVFNVICIFCV